MADWIAVQEKTCQACHGPFTPGGPRSLYCLACNPYAKRCKACGVLRLPHKSHRCDKTA